MIKQESKEIVILHKIERFYAEDEFNHKIDSRYSSGGIARRRVKDRESSLENMRRFDKFSKKIDNSPKKLNLDDFSLLKKEFLKFVIEDRIKEKLRIKLYIDLDKEYQLFFFPESDSLYNTFILFLTTLETIERDVISYVDFLRSSPVIKRSLRLGSTIHIYVKINKDLEFISKFIDHFSFSEEFNLRTITLKSEVRDESYIQKTSILVGKNLNFISTHNNYNDLSFYLFIKDYYRKFI